MDLTAVLARARSGSDASVTELVDRFYPTVRDQVHRELDADHRKSRPWLASLFSTGDVVHDVFLRVLQGLNAFEGSERDFERYLAKAVVNRLVDAIRFHEAARRDGRRHGGVSAEIELASTDTSPGTAASRNEEAALVEEALRTLTTRDHALLDLRMRRGMRFRQIAAELDLPSEDAARKATQAAEARLLVALRARGLE